MKDVILDEVKKDLNKKEMEEIFKRICNERCFTLIGKLNSKPADIP